MRFRPGRSLALIVALAAPAVLPAQGFGLNEIGSCAVARVGATTSAPCEDASSIYWNPAAPAGLKGISVYAGVASIGVGGDFTADTTGRVEEPSVPTEFPPHLFINWRGNHRYALGLGVYVPYGLTSQWKDDFSGRFTAQRASLATIYVQPNIAIEITPNWSIGGGPVFGRSTVELVQSLDLSQQVIPGSTTGATFASLGIAPNTEFGRASLEGSASGYGFHVGVHGKIGTTLQVGARFLSSMAFKYENATARFIQLGTGLVVADATLAGQLGVPVGTPWEAILAPNFRAGGPLVQQKVRTLITHPGQIQFGVGYTAPTGTLVSVDAAHIRWSKFDVLPVTFLGAARTRSRTLLEDYDDSWAVRGSAEHKLANVSLRGGISWVKTPAPDVTVTPLLPDQDRMNYAFGVGLPFSFGKTPLAFDASYLLVDTQGRRGRVIERTSASQTAEQLNSGFYRLKANIFSISLKAQL